MDAESKIRKSILKKQEERFAFQRSNSVNLSPVTNAYADGSSGSETPKKRAHIRDENGVWLPGEPEDLLGQPSTHFLKESVADPTAGERVSYRLIQQRSLDYGLQNQLNRVGLEQDAEPSSNDDNPRASAENPLCTPPTGSGTTLDSAQIPHELGRILASHSPSEDAVIQLLQPTPSGPGFSLRDVLAHRLPVFNDDEDEECNSGSGDATLPAG